MKVERNNYYDWLKGVAILMVIGIHTFVGGGFNSFHEWLNTGVRQILNCAVPIFIASSGFFLANKKLNNKQVIIEFYKKQISRVYIPCLLWSIPWFVLHIFGGNSVSMGILKLFFCGFSIFYFVILIIQYYLLLPVIRKPQMGGVILSTACSLVCVTGVMYVTAIKNIEVPLTMYAGPFPLWVVFFVLGVFLANGNRDYKLGYIIVGIVVTLSLQIFESRWLLMHSMNGVGYGIKPTSFLFSVLIILFFFSKKIEISYKSNQLFNRAIAFIGKVSFVVYLSHTLVIFLLSRVPLYNNVLWFFRFLVVAIVDLLLVGLLYRLIPQKIKQIIGF